MVVFEIDVCPMFVAKYYDDVWLFKFDRVFSFDGELIGVVAHFFDGPEFEVVTCVYDDYLSVKRYVLKGFFCVIKVCFVFKLFLNGFSKCSFSIVWFRAVYPVMSSFD